MNKSYNNPFPYFVGIQTLQDIAPKDARICVMNILGNVRPRKIVYVSCHPGSLARDAGVLVNEMGYQLQSAGVMDMFPHTAHVESIAVFQKA